MANTAYNKVKTSLPRGEINLLTDTIKVLLVTGYTINIDSHDFYSDVSAYEVVGTGYTIGGIALSGRGLPRDNVNDRTEFSASDVTWSSSTITANGAIVYKYSGDMGTSPLIVYIDFGVSKSTTGTDFKIEWSNEDGVLYIT